MESDFGFVLVLVFKAGEFLLALCFVLELGVVEFVLAFGLVNAHFRLLHSDTGLNEVF